MVPLNTSSNSPNVNVWSGMTRLYFFEKRSCEKNNDERYSNMLSEFLIPKIEANKKLFSDKIELFSFSERIFQVFEVVFPPLYLRFPAMEF